MSWKQVAKSGGGDNFEKAPPGNHPAVLVALIDLGVQENEFNGEKKYQHRAFFCWELTSEKNTKGNNFIIGIYLTVSMGDKAKLRQWVDAWRGRKTNDGEEFDISSLVGKKCLLSVTESRGYSKVNGVAQVPKGMAVPKPTHQLTTFSIDDIKTAGEKLETAIKAGRGRPKKCSDEAFSACDHLSVKAAAEVLEMSIDAVRKRRIRMKLESERKTR